MTRSHSIIAILLFLLIGCTEHSRELMYETNLLHAIELSKAQNKPIFIHFTGHGSGGVNEFMDKLVISNSIRKTLNDDFILVQLYVDDQTHLARKDTIGIHKVVKSIAGKERVENSTKIGNLNYALEIELLNTNVQPQYMIVDSGLNPMIESFGYIKGDQAYFMRQLKKGSDKYIYTRTE